jgi:hypothetical protein
VCFIAPAGGQEDAMPPDPAALVDDFQSADYRAPNGETWRVFTDRVMGGLSQADAFHVEEDGRRFLRLMGLVSLANNGGFIQTALPLGTRQDPRDASNYAGIRLEVMTEDEGYAIHLRTRDCRRPWEHYKAEIPPGEGWRTVEIPFADFGAYALDTPLDPAGLTRLGIVAGSREFVADIRVARVEFFGQAP